MGRKKPSKKKIPPLVGDVGGRKKQVKDSTQPSNMGKNPSWQIANLQLDGVFGWSIVNRDKLLEIIGKLVNLERMTWGEIQRNTKGFHSVEISSLTKDAQRELERLQLSDTSELYSIRLSGIERVWGIKIGTTVRLLWWDPQHQVCQSNLKHT